MEQIDIPMFTEDMHLLSDAFFNEFEFETFQLPDVAEPVTQGPPGPPGILRHDCMWNGTCIDKDHDYNFRNHCKERNQRSNKANSNRSLLISNSKIEKRKNTTTSINKQTIKKMFNNKQNEYNCQTSDGELPDTPPDSDSDNEIPSFKHEININEKLSECMNEFEELFSVSEVTGQSIVYETDNNNNNNNRYFGGRKMMNISEQEMNNDNETSDEDDDDEEEEDSDDHDEEEEEEQVEEQVKNIKTSTNENINSAIIQNNKEMQQNTLNDHCYYTQNVNTKKFDNLGVCTPSDSEEEIDVVTFEKPSKPSLPTFPSIAEQKSFQMTVNNALIKPAPRPRGRPPLNSNNNNNINNNINNINNNIININTINNINSINTINNNNNTNIINNNIINNNNNIIVNNYNNNNNANSRKRVVQEQKQNKRAKQSNPYQRKPKVEKNIPMNKLPIIEPIIYKQEPIFKQEPMNDYEGNDFHSDDEPETDKRNLHNNMERQRRIELKDSFEFLRRLVPDLIEIDKAPKVKILNTAANYCEKLTVRYNELDYQKRELVKTQLRLKETVSKLRRTMSERFLGRAH
ncbi:putative uncharacterized protein DDB_G0282133 isoform X2 [Aphidius gifuensis]|nr:putative uncharacterized protein DDB_G0282133 isoform X2 [Aphidius gifuensis]